MCKLFDWLIPPTNNSDTVERGVITATAILNTFKKHGIVWACDPYFGLEDYWLHYAKKLEDWLEWCYEARSQCPPYTDNTEKQAGFDCDDFADFFPAWCKAKHKVNAIWEVWGDYNGGGHGWNIVQCKDGIYEIEPQTGEAWPLLSNPSYKPIIVK